MYSTAILSILRYPGREFVLHAMVLEDQMLQLLELALVAREEV